MKTHTFCGRKYHIAFDKLDGSADQESDAKKWLMVFRGLNDKAGLETLIHEALHACDWKARENEVTDTARDIARFLWRLGFRRTT